MVSPSPLARSSSRRMTVPFASHGVATSRRTMYTGGSSYLRPQDISAVLLHDLLGHPRGHDGHGDAREGRGPGHQGDHGQQGLPHGGLAASLVDQADPLPGG